MKIQSIEVATVQVPLPVPRGLSGGPITHSSDLVCRITTDEGLRGIGEARGSPLPDVARVVVEALTPLLVGATLDDPRALWDQMHARLFAEPAPGVAPRTRLAALAAVDLALWDIVARAAGVSVCRLLGGEPRPMPAYLSEGFYIEGQPLGEMAEEAAAGMAAGGYRAVKIRIGRDPAGDAARVRAVRAVIGPDADLMVDVNQAWDLERARRTLPLLEEFGLYWLEEPVRVRYGLGLDPDGLCGQVAALTSIPIASGENHTTLEDCLSLVERGGIRYVQFDAIKNGGVTEFLRVAELCRERGIALAPHHVPHFHVQLAAAMPHAVLVETFDNAKQHPAWPNLFPGFSEVRGGHVSVPEGPGWGMEISEEFVDRYGVKVAWRA